MSNYGNLAALEGRLRHCVRYKGSGSKKRCAKFAAGPGKPRGRKKAGISRRFVERSTTKRRAHRVCASRYRAGAKAGRCKTWRFVSAARMKSRRKGRCLKWGGKSASTGKRICRKRAVGAVRRHRGVSRRRTGKRRRMSTSKRLAAEMRRQAAATGTEGFFGFGSVRRRSAKRHCTRKGRGKGGRKVCRKWSK